MEVLGMSSISIKSGCSMRMMSTSGLTSSAARNYHFLKSTKVSSANSSKTLQCRRREGEGVNAALMEPSNPNESSRLEFGRLPEDLSSVRSITAKSMTNAAPATSVDSSTSLQFSAIVEEAINFREKVRKARSLAHDTERMRREMIPLHQLRQGGFVANSLMYRQIFVIRSYEVGPDKSMSIKEIFSLFQEMALNHVQLLGIAGDGFGATRAMNRLGLIWVVTKMQVEVERYPVWPEVIEIDSWVAAAGKNGMRRDWIMRSYQTGEVLARATSTWCMMNHTTRRLSKIPDEVRSEIVPCFMDNYPTVFRQDEEVPRVTKMDVTTTEHQSSQLKPTPADLDMNQHVNNLKYINWVLDSVPVQHMETHLLASIVLEYRRECHSTDIVESLTGSKSDMGEDVTEFPRPCCQYTHLLRTQDAGHEEILRGRTTWRSRYVDRS